MTDDKINRIARRYIAGLISYQWALWLVSQEIQSTDAWTPIVALSKATQKLLGK